MCKLLKIPILGVNQKLRQYDTDVINFINEDLLQSNSGIELEDISDSFTESLDNAMEIVEKSNNKVIFLTDAMSGNTTEYELATRAMFKRNIEPFVLVTHVESAKFDLEDISMLPTDLVEYIDCKADPYEYFYNLMFFNFNTKKYFQSIDGDKVGVDIFAERLKKYYTDADLPEINYR